jgi:hypothetical protein
MGNHISITLHFFTFYNIAFEAMECVEDLIRGTIA